VPTPDGSPFCLSRGSPRGHNRGHLSVISVGVPAKLATRKCRRVRSRHRLVVPQLAGSFPVVHRVCSGLLGQRKPWSR
jgi:hypothetical protein